MENKIDIAIVDDHPIVIQGLRALLAQEPELHIAGTFIDGAGILSFLKSNTVDIVLLDITLPDRNGMDLCADIKTIAPDTLVLILSNHSERSIVMQTIQNGASGYLLKNAAPEEMLHCIREALKGHISYSKEVMEIISKPARNEIKGLPRLTKREQQILKMIAEGKTSNAIAEELFLSPLTVETHRRNLIQKFEVKNAAELVMMATRHHLI